MKLLFQGKKKIKKPSAEKKGQGSIDRILSSPTDKNDRLDGLVKITIDRRIDWSKKLINCRLIESIWKDSGGEYL